MTPSLLKDTSLTADLEFHAAVLRATDALSEARGALEDARAELPLDPAEHLPLLAKRLVALALSRGSLPLSRTRAERREGLRHWTLRKTGEHEEVTLREDGEVRITSPVGDSVGECYLIALCTLTVFVGSLGAFLLGEIPLSTFGIVGGITLLLGGGFALLAYQLWREWHISEAWTPDYRHLDEAALADLLGYRLGEALDQLEAERHLLEEEAGTVSTPRYLHSLERAEALRQTIFEETSPALPQPG